MYSSQSVLPVASVALVLMTTFSLATASVTDAKQSHCDATLSARFIESAPRDRFTFVNTSKPGWSINHISIELAESQGNLVFDTESGGLGVEVYQPYKLEDSSAGVANVLLPDDGEQTIEITFAQFPAGANYTFSIDVDDQLTRSALGNIRVTGGEMKGAQVSVGFISDSGDTALQQTTFDTNNRAVIGAGCA